MKAAGISLHMIDLGGDTTGNGVSKLVFTILSAVAEAERDRTRERVAEVKRDQRQRGRYLGGAVPWGYRVGEAGELVPIPEQQAAIRRMRKLRDQGLALRAIADRLAARCRGQYFIPRSPKKRGFMRDNCCRRRLKTHRAILGPRCSRMVSVSSTTFCASPMYPSVCMNSNARLNPGSSRRQL
jgi:hypothetical protein